MVWLKLSDDFTDRLARTGVSDAAFRTHIEALSWTMRYESGGAIDEIDIKRFADSEQAPAAIQELVDKDIWRKEEREDSGQKRHRFRLMMGMEDQPTPEQIETRRAGNSFRQHQKRERDRQKTEHKIAEAKRDLGNSNPPTY